MKPPYTDNGHYKLRFAVPAGSAGQKLALFTSNETAQFISVAPPAIGADGTFVLSIAPNAVYTLSTLLTAKKGLHVHRELPAPFPLPHVIDNFSNYSTGRSPKFFTDWDGSFSIEGGVLRQKVMEPPQRWHCTDVDPISLVGPGYSNYVVEATAKIDDRRNASNYVAICARLQKPFDGWCPSASGYCLRVSAGNTWSLVIGAYIAATHDHLLPAAPNGNCSNRFGCVFRSGKLPSRVSAASSLRLKLRTVGTSIEASVNGVEMLAVSDAHFDNGPAAVSTGYHTASFSSFSMAAVEAASAGPGLGSTVAAYPVFTGVALSHSESSSTGLFGMALTALEDVTVSSFARMRAGGSSGRHLVQLLCAKIGPAQKDPKCRGAQPADGSGLGRADIVMSTNASDATGLVWGRPKTSIALIRGQQYYLVSEENSKGSSGDPFYRLAKSYSCIGSPGPGGTLPKLDVQVTSVRIDGGISRECTAPADGPMTDCKPWGELLWDYRPRSFGPLSLAVAGDNVRGGSVLRLKTDEGVDLIAGDGATTTQERRPHIVLIVADDLGWNGVSWYRSS